MIKRFLLFAFTLSNGIFLTFLLCLGSQNLRYKHQLNLGLSSSEKYPTGFIVGVSSIFGFLSGGFISSVVITKEKE